MSGKKVDMFDNKLVKMSDNFESVLSFVNDCKKEYILNFIKKTFDIRSFGRMREIEETTDDNNDYIFNINDNSDRSEYDDFLKHNKNCISKMNNDELNFLYILCKKIEDENIIMEDEDDFVEWEASSVYFNSKNKLVIMHPR